MNTTPSMYRYPLPAHDVPHDWFDCGDPEWCLHEKPSERADAVFELRPILEATSPRIFGSDIFQFATDIPSKLQQLGFDGSLANSLAVVFHDDLTTEGMKIHGAFNGETHYGVDEQILKAYPLAVHVRSGLSLERDK